MKTVYERLSRENQKLIDDNLDYSITRNNMNKTYFCRQIKIFDAEVIWSAIHIREFNIKEFYKLFNIIN